MTNIYDSTNISSQEAARHLPAAAVNSASAVSWGAIFAGAAAAASLALMLLMLGAGLGLTSISPWENQGLAAGTVGIAAIAWLTFTQIVASGMGGYLAGRLRTKWVDTHTNNLFPRYGAWLSDMGGGAAGISRSFNHHHQFTHRRQRKSHWFRCRGRDGNRRE